MIHLRDWFSINQFSKSFCLVDLADFLRDSINFDKKEPSFTKLIIYVSTYFLSDYDSKLNNLII